ncbi:MAG: hypothetical protein JJD97_00135 [Gemmatimonadaceae bacterium]|nr:hypothetical protein [Gemmatimonadaceae bacterium]
MFIPPEDLAIPIFVVITAWMFKAWLTHQEKMKGLSIPKQDRVMIDARLERLEQAVESIAIEIERVSEGTAIRDEADERARSASARCGCGASAASADGHAALILRK